MSTIPTGGYGFTPGQGGAVACVKQGWATIDGPGQAAGQPVNASLATADLPYFQHAEFSDEFDPTEFSTVALRGRAVAQISVTIKKSGVTVTRMTARGELKC